MIIIKVCGGLGNQLFQWALYLKLQSLGKEVYLDISAYEKGIEMRPLWLQKLDKDIRYCDPRIKQRMANSSNRLLRKIVKPKKTHVYERKVLVFDENILTLDHAYLEGYWQNEKYFRDIRETILDKLSNVKIRPESIQLIQGITANESVAVHVRRGDFLNFPRIYGEICTVEYYEKAFQIIREKVSHPVFYIFSDDIEWCKNEMKWHDNIIFVENECDDDPFDTIRAMSLCKHNIIANSSFSWWAAWLNENKKKIVISPDRWLANHEETDIICADWIRVANEI